MTKATLPPLEADPELIDVVGHEWKWFGRDRRGRFTSRQRVLRHQTGPEPSLTVEDQIAHMEDLWHRAAVFLGILAVFGGFLVTLATGPVGLGVYILCGIAGDWLTRDEA